MSKKAALLLANGFEEVEAVSPIDYLRRAGIEVTVISIGKDKTVTGAHGVRISADMLLSALEKRDRGSLDAVLLPGGMPGASNIAASAGAGALIEELYAAGKLVCAICAAPAVALAPLGILAGRRFTCYPGMEKQAVQIQKDAEWSEDPVVIDGNLITSRGPGTAGAWALAIAGKLAGEGTAKKIAEAALFQKSA